MRRGDVYRAGLNPVVGSEQSGTRPVVIVSRDAINATGVVFIIVPVTARANKKHIYKSHVELKMGRRADVRFSRALRAGPSHLRKSASGSYGQPYSSSNGSD